MAKKQNPLLAQYEAIWEARYMARLRETLRIGEDALLIAADDVVGVTEEQAVEMLRVYKETVIEIAQMVADDSTDDPEAVWSKTKVDDRIRGIVGDKDFEPWETRHR